MWCCDSGSNFKTGKQIIGFIAILMGLQTYSYGHSQLDQNLHELRLTFSPNSQGSQQVCSGTTLTWEDINQYAIFAQAALLVFSGLLILINRKCTGGLLLFLGVIFLVIIKDLPWLRHSSLKTIHKERNERLTDLLKNLSILGSSILLMSDKSPAKRSAPKVREVVSSEQASKYQVKKKGGKSKQQ